jgi:hypothetical protein
LKKADLLDLRHQFLFEPELSPYKRFKRWQVLGNFQWAARS